MARNHSLYDRLPVRFALLVVVLLTGFSGTPAVAQGQDRLPFRLSGAQEDRPGEREENRLPFRLSGAPRNSPEAKKAAIEVSSNESQGDETEKSIEPEQPSGVVTGEVGEAKGKGATVPEEGRNSKPASEFFRMKNLLPAPRVEKSGSTGTAGDGELSARANFRLSARKTDSSPSEPSSDEEASSTRMLMGPPDPSAIGLEVDGRVPPDPAYTAAGARGLGRAVSAYKSGEELPLPGRDIELPSGGGLPEIEEDGETLFSNWLPGQQGTPYSAADAAEPMPGASTQVETWADSGYFPTQDDNLYIGDWDYPRGGPGGGGGWGPAGATWRGPDFHSQTFTGIFPYDSPEQSFYDRHGYFFDPLDRTLGFFSPHDALVMENDRLQNFSTSLDATFPVVTNTYASDRAHLKLGPLYFDLLSMGAGVLYSDFKGAKDYPKFPPGEEPGWLSYIDVDVRGLLQITNNFYLSAATRLMYLPEVNRVAFVLGYGTGPALSFRMNYEDKWGAWDVQFYDQFSGYPGIDIYTEFGSGAIDRAGRYYFGIPRFDRESDLFNQGDALFLNTLAAQASRPLGRDWRLWLAADHNDFWNGWDFDQHSKRDHGGILVGYEGSRIPFSPYFAYDAYSTDGLKSFFHTARVGGTGRITENLSLNAEGGYLWSSNNTPDTEQWLWRVGLTHDINERTRHSVSLGQGFFVSDFYADPIVADYINYNFQHQLARTLNANFYAQWSEEDVLSGDSERRKRQTYGGYLDFRPGDYTAMAAGAYYDESRYADGEFDDERWIYYGMLTQRVLSRLSVWFRYQFEDSNYYDEHLYMTGVRRYF